MPGPLERNIKPDPAFSITVPDIPGESKSDRMRREALARDEFRAKEKEAAMLKPLKPKASWFTTAYAIDWGKEQGWKLLRREGFDYRTTRSHDLELGSDALFLTDEGMVYVQGAGKNEKPDHWQRFVERGGVEQARKMRVRFVYIEFVRDQAEPIKIEWWA